MTVSTNYAVSGTPLSNTNSAAIESLVSGDRKVFVPPSGDATGATDTAVIQGHIAQGSHIHLGDGDWYFDDTLVRMPRRTLDGTSWVMSYRHNPSGDALIPDFTANGAEVCRLHFLDVTKPAIYVWRPPAGIAGGPTVNVRSRANASDVSTDPLTIGGGETRGFTIIGAANPVFIYQTGSRIFDLDNEALWPNHIGFAIWGAGSDHKLIDVVFQNFGNDIVLHDTTGLEITDVVCKDSDLGLCFGIQTDSTNITNTWFNGVRIGHVKVWEGWQTGTGRSATFAPIGRENNGTYLAYTSSDCDNNKFTESFFVGCAMSAIASRSDITKTPNVDIYGTTYDTVYFELNASISYGFRNASQGSDVFRACNFRGLVGSDVVGTYVQGGAKTGPASEILRKWIPSRFGVSQNTADANFGQFWTYGGAASTGSIVIENSHIDATPYPFIFAPGTVAVHWLHSYSPVSGVDAYPNIYANLANAQKGYRVNSATYGWSNANGQDWGDYVIQGGFAKPAGGVFTSVQTTVALPTPSAAYRGHQRTIASAAGTTDTTYQCLKSAANTYSWVALGTGG